MPVYNVFLGDVNSGLDQDIQNSIQQKLQTWFTQITQGTDYQATVRWVTSAPNVQPYELLVYFVQSVLDSVVRDMPGSSSVVYTSEGGITVMTPAFNASEVHINLSSSILPEIAFHELMHNKLNVNDAVLHSNNGLASVPISPGTTPSPQNKTLMRNALSRTRTQWTGGWSASTDPLAGMDI